MASKRESCEGFAWSCIRRKGHKGECLSPNVITDIEARARWAAARLRRWAAQASANELPYEAAHFTHAAGCMDGVASAERAKRRKKAARAAGR
jgi:hypothetical protein